MKKLHPLNSQRQCFLKWLINLGMGPVKFLLRHFKLVYLKIRGIELPDISQQSLISIFPDCCKNISYSFIAAGLSFL